MSSEHPTDPMNPPPVVIVLAAGRGSRFEGPGHKLSQPFTDASVLETTLGNVVASGLPLVLVTTDALLDVAVRRVARADIVHLPAAEAQRGMARSIVAGVSARGYASGWLVMPADMPMVKPATLRAVAEALPGHACVVPYCEGRRGHPVGFASELFPDLMALEGDEGARRLLRRYPSHALEVADPGILVDIDTASDLQAARVRAQHLDATS